MSTTQPQSNDEQPGAGMTIRDVSGRVAFAQVGGNLTGDIIAGDKHVVQYITEQKIIRQTERQIVTAPYKFLSAYDISDRDIFFGRNAVIEELVGKMPRYKTLVINGRSGSGKTSLINAGLIPRLAAQDYQFLSFRDYSDPLRQLREHVAQNDLFKAYTDQTDSLTQFLKTATRQHQQHVVVIFDQFERFFVNVPPILRTQFIQELKACLDSDLSGEELDLVFALREDFFGAFVIEFETQIPTFFNQTDRFNLLPLNRDEAREAILRPLKNIPVHIGYNLPFVDEILLPGLMSESTGRNQIDPPHLQIVCNQLYESVRRRYAADLEQGGLAQIDRQLYTELGETSGILRTYLDDFIDRAAHRDSGGRDVLRSMLKLMLETTGTRKFVSLVDLHKGLPDVPPTAVEEHIREFQDGRIIETRGEGAAARYSLSHEVMVEKVQSWFDERELERKRAQEILERGLAEWKTTQALLNAKQVEHIRKWSGGQNLSAEAEQLLTQSQQAYEERQRKEAEQERRIRRNRNAFQMALGIGFVVALILSALAFWQQTLAVKEKHRAEEQTVIAQTNADEAEKQAKIAQANETEAKKQKTEAETQTHIAQARRLATESQTVFESYPQRSLLLAIEALNATVGKGEPRVSAAEQTLRDMLTQMGGTGTSGILIANYSQNGWWVVFGTAKKASLRDMTVQPPAKDIFTLKHESLVLGAGFSQDGHWLVTADMPPDNISSATATWRLWDLTAPDPASTAFLVPEKSITACEFTPDGHWLITGHQDGNVRLWDLTTTPLAARVLVFTGHTDSITSVVVSPDNHWLFTGSKDMTVRRWDLQAPAPETTAAILEKYAKEITGMAISPDGRWLCSRSTDQTAWLRNLTAQDKEESAILLNKHTKNIRSAEFSPDGHWLITGGDDKMAYMWDVTTDHPEEHVIALEGHTDPVHCIAFSQDSHWLATGDGDFRESRGTVRLWDLNASNPAKTSIVLRGHEGMISSIAFKPDGQKLLTTSFNDVTLRLWDLTKRNPAETATILNGHTNQVTTLAVSTDNHWIVSGSVDKSVRLWDLTADDPASTVRVLSGHTDTIRSVAVSPNNHWIASGSIDHTVRVWDLTAPNPATTAIILHGHDDAIDSVTFSLDSRWLISGSRDKTIRLWDVTSPTPETTMCTLHGHEDGISKVIISPDGHWLATISTDQTARLWDLTAIDPEKSAIVIDRQPIAVWSTAFSSDSHWLATAGSDGIARLWDITTKDPVQSVIVLKGHEGSIQDVTFSADGRWLVTGSWDHTARLWDLHAPNPAETMIVLSGHTNYLWRVAISADSHWLVTGSWDGTVRLWDLMASHPETTAVILPGQIEPLSNITFSPDGHWVVAAEQDNTIRLWPLQPEELITQACQISVRNLSKAEWAQYFPDEPYRKTCPDLP